MRPRTRGTRTHHECRSEGAREGASMFEARTRSNADRSRAPAGAKKKRVWGKKGGRVCEGVCHTPSSSSSPLTPHALPLSSCVCVCVATPSSSSSDPSEQRRRPRKGARVYIDGSHQPDTPTHTACRCGQRRVLPVSPVSGRLVPTGARGAPFAMHPRGRRKA